MLRLGTISCSEEEMNDFILRGIQHSNLSYLYIATTAVKAKCFAEVNMSDSRLTIWPVSGNNASISHTVRDNIERQFLGLPFNQIEQGKKML